MNSIVKLSTALAIALTLTACGGGGGGKSNNGGSNTPSGNTTNGSIGNNTNSSTGNTTEGNQTNGNNTNNNQTDSNTTNPPHPYSYGYACDGEVIVNGYLLPPCSDPKLNDSTLLGIDSNNNGVRDDVERWLIVRYKNDHKIVTEIGFQGAKAHQFMLENPNEAEEARKLINGAQSCNSYFQRYADEFGEPILIDHDIITDKRGFKSISLNTESRIRAFFAYDRKLSGGVYRLPHADERRALCLFDVNQLLGK